MKTSTMLLIGGVAVLGGMLIFLSGPKLKIISVDKAQKTVSFSFNGKTYTHKLGQPDIGIMANSYSLVAHATPTFMQLTINKNGKPVRQENISLV